MKNNKKEVDYSNEFFEIEDTLGLDLENINSDVDDTEVDYEEEKVIFEDGLDDLEELDNDEPEEPKEKSKKTKEVKEDKVEETNVDDDTEENAYYLFAKGLKEKNGIFGAIDDEDLKDIDTDDKLYTALANDVDKAVNDNLEHILNEINNNSKGLWNHLKNGGKVEDFINVYKDKDYSNISAKDLDGNDDLADEIILELYKEKGWDNEKAKKKLNRLIDKEEEALEALEELKVIKENKKKALEESTKLQREEAARKQKELLDTINSNIEKTEEFIPGKILDKKTKEKVSKSLNETWSKVIQNPAKYAHILSLLDHYKILEGDFSKIITDQTTTANKKLANVLKRTDVSKNKVKTNNDASNALLYSIKNRNK